MQIDYNELTRSSVHKIREIARNIGVKSPTLLTKQKLIEQIMKIHNKEIEPSFNKRRVGRPPKSLNFNPTPPNFASYELENKKNGNFTLNYPSSYFTSVEENEQTLEFRGCLSVNENYGVFLVDDSKRVFVSMAMINYHKLRTGDMLTVKANSDLSNKNMYVTVRVVKADNFTLGEERQLFENLQLINTKENIENNLSFLQELVLKTGNKYFIELTEFSKQHVIASEMVKNFSSSYNTYYLNFDGNRNDSKLVNETKIIFNEMEQEKLQKVNVFFEHIKRQVEKGERCIVIFSALWKYMRELNLYYHKQTSNKVLLQTIIKIRDIVALARNTKNGGSITMFIIDNLDMPEMYKEIIRYDVIANMDGTIKL